MRSLRIIVLTGLCTGLVAGCSLPRGAAGTSQILKGTEDSTKGVSENGISVVHVSRSNIASVNSWHSTDKNEVRPPWPSSAGQDQENRLAPGDRVAVMIWDNDPNSLLTHGMQPSAGLPPATVSRRGTITLPYVGTLKVSGMTEDVARAHIQGEIRKTQPTAEVQIAITPGRMNSVSVIGGVGTPGTYPLPDGGMPVLSMLSASGGVQSTISAPLVRLIRGKQVYETRAESLLNGETADVMLRGGDQLAVIPDPRRFTVLGAAGTEQVLAFDKEKTTALEALARAGGLMATRADLRGVLVLRNHADKDVSATGPTADNIVYALDMTTADGLFAARNFVIRPGDTILATESPVVSARTVLSLLGSTVGINNQLQ